MCTIGKVSAILNLATVVLSLTIEFRVLLVEVSVLICFSRVQNALHS